MAANMMHVTLDVHGLPGLLEQLRGELAGMLRAQAAAEANPEVGQRLLAIAEAFTQALSGVEGKARVAQAAPVSPRRERLEANAIC